jgi:hypothetical protein
MFRFFLSTSYGMDLAKKSSHATVSLEDIKQIGEVHSAHSKFGPGRYPK